MLIFMVVVDVALFPSLTGWGRGPLVAVENWPKAERDAFVLVGGWVDACMLCWLRFLGVLCVVVVGLDWGDVLFHGRNRKKKKKKNNRRRVHRKTASDRSRLIIGPDFDLESRFFVD